MEVWQPRGGSWAPSHCVLTRAGFLHWFKSMESPERVDVLSLSECDLGDLRVTWGCDLGGIWHCHCRVLHANCPPQLPLPNTQRCAAKPSALLRQVPVLSRARPQCLTSSSICLTPGKCQFEQGKAPVFNLVEASGGAVSWLGGRSRKITFQAPSVEECCEWASECCAPAHPTVPSGFQDIPSCLPHLPPLFAVLCAVLKLAIEYWETTSTRAHSASTCAFSTPAVALREAISLAVNGSPHSSGPGTG